TINVYADDSLPGGTPDTLPLREPITTDEDPASASETYGAMKVGCEQTVSEGATSSTIVRPGLIVGPGDPSGRFTYWPARLADGGDVLAPGSPDEVVQVIDVRDLAAWIVDLAEHRRSGVFDGSGRETSRADFLEQVATGVDSRPTYVWADQDFLAAQNVEPWSGPRSLPVWLPLPEYAGLLAHDVGASYRAGLQTRPLAETARDTLAWLREHPDAVVTGLTRDEESEVLAALRQS
ncbi:MAG: NAD-dependent epimerase/dehydratase family protein, partial [Nocardioides sp.]